MEKTIIMDVAAQAAQAVAHAAPGPQDARARRPYGAPELQAVGLGPVFAEYVYQTDEGDNEGPSGNTLFGSSSGSSTD